MINYSIRKVSVDGFSHILVFDFMPNNEILSGFLVTDSQLVFGHHFEYFNDIMRYENYKVSGNAYAIKIQSENVRITCIVDVENEESISISRKEFIWVMNEWIRENRKLKSTDSKEESVHSSKVLRQQNKLLSKICRLFGKR